MGQITMTPDAKQAFDKHVLQEYPKEACGVLVNDKYFPCRNISPTPEQTFKLNPLDYFDASRHGPIQAILHSHPFDSRKPPKWSVHCPSEQDQISWLKGTIPWGIVATSGDNVTDVVWMNEDYIAPLVGRYYVGGIYDCYSLCRDYYRLNLGITFPHVPRGLGWWKDKERNLFVDNFAATGFVEVPVQDARINDIMLIQAGTRMISHACVITGPNEVLDHSMGQLSRHRSQSTFLPYLKMVVRHKDLL